MSLSGVLKRGQLASKQRESDGRKRWGGNKRTRQFRTSASVAAVGFSLLTGKFLKVSVTYERHEDGKNWDVRKGKSSVEEKRCNWKKERKGKTCGGMEREKETCLQTTQVCRCSYMNDYLLYSHL